MPRSGTTLLSRLLHAHPALAIAPETHYFTRCWDGAAIDGPRRAQAYLDCLLRQPGVADMAMTDEELEAVRQAVREADVATHRDLLDALLSRYAAAHDAPYWGEKTPEHLAYVRPIAEEFPEAAFLVLMRDPRDVSRSLRRMPWNQGKTVVDHAGQWARAARLAQQYKSDAALHVHVLRYEDLIEAPEDRLRAVCEFLDLSYEPRMLGAEGGDANFDPEREPWKAKAQQAIDPSNKEKWRGEMPAVERKIMETWAGAEMDAFGYPLEELSWRMGMAGPLARILAETFSGQLRRAWRHGLQATPTNQMPWRDAAGRSES